MSFQHVLLQGEPLNFAIVVDVKNSVVVFKACKLYDDTCLDAAASISGPFKLVDLGKGINRLALISENVTPQLKFACRISESKMPLCWSPESSLPRLCSV